MSLINELPPAPEGTRYVLRQAGGHHEQNGDAVIPNLEHNDGSFLKLYRTPQRGATELAFYQQIFDEDCGDLTLLALRNFIPKFNGIFTTKILGEEVQFLKVEDITRRFARPCVLDVKLKADVHDPASHHAHPTYIFAEKYGFLIDGIQVYHRKSRKYKAFGKAFGRKLDEEGVRRGLYSFLNADSGIDTYIVSAFLERLQRIRSWASRQQHFSFYRSSLLLVYDAQDTPCLNLEQGLNRTDIRMVDFAKVYSSNQSDSRYEIAIGNLMQCITHLLPRVTDEKNTLVLE